MNTVYAVAASKRGVVEGGRSALTIQASLEQQRCAARRQSSPASKRADSEKEENAKREESKTGKYLTTMRCISGRDEFELKFSELSRAGTSQFSS